MKRFTLPAIFIILISFTAIFAAEEINTAKYAEITASIVPVHTELDPSSPVVMQLHRGQIKEITGEGKLWIKVQTDKGDGWIPISDCRIIDKNDTAIAGNPIKTIFFALGLLIIIGVFAFYIVRQKKLEEASI